MLKSLKDTELILYFVINNYLIGFFPLLSYNLVEFLNAKLNILVSVFKVT